MSISFDQFAAMLRQHSKSSSRYKSVVVYSPELTMLAHFSSLLKGAEPNLLLLDGLKLLFSSKSGQFSDQVAAKYWIQRQAKPDLITCLIRLDWAFGKWPDFQRHQWWETVASFETGSTVLVCTTLKVLSEQWQPAGILSLPGAAGALSVFKPSSSKFKFD